MTGAAAPQNVPSAAPSCLHCAARRDGICSDLAAANMNSISRFKAGERQIGAGTDIIGPGESSRAIYNLVDGWAFRYGLLEDGRRQILDFILPGAVIGLQNLYGAKATYGVQALTDATVCVLRQDDFVTFARETPEIGMRLAWLIARERSLAYDHLTSVGRQCAHQRVAHLILELFVRYRAQWPGSRIEEMHLPLTQEHIGDAVGLTAVHVNRVLRDLRADGVLEFHYRRLTILNPDKLIDVAETDPNLMKSWTVRVALANEEPAASGVGEKNRAHGAASRHGSAPMREAQLLV